MDSTSKNALTRIGIFFVLLFSLLSLNGCMVQFVSDYDAATYEEILRVSKEVDRFYGELLEEEQSQRSYDKYAEAYVELESELRSLVMRNNSRPLNSESTKISQSILDLWIKYKTKHKDKNTYKTGVAKLDRKRFIRLFTSAASAEKAKQLDPDDADSGKDSKDAP